MGVKYSGDGSHIYTCTAGGAIRKWDGFGFVKADARAALSTGNPVRQFAVSQDGRFVFHPEGNVVKCVDAESGKVIRRLCGHVDNVNACIFRNDALEVCSSGHDLHTILWQSKGNLHLSEGVDDEIDYWSD